MTLAELNQYQGICAELREIEVKIHKSKVCDTVSGSDAEFPYTKRTIKLYGTAASDAELLRRKEELIRKRNDIRNYIYGIPDTAIRLIFINRFIYGYSWDKVAMKLGGKNTKDSVRMACKRFLQKQ